MQLNPQDAQFLYMESSRNLTHVTSIAIYDPSTVPGGKTVRFKDIIGHMRDRLHMSPFLKRRLVRLPLEMDYPYWVDDEYFDLEYHIHHGRLPEPADWRQFCIHVARYHSRPLDMNRPAWDMFVIEGLDNIEGITPGSYAIAIKIHHAAADGASLMRFFGAISDIDNKGTPGIPLKQRREKPATLPSPPEIAKRAFINNFVSPMKMTKAMRRSAPALYNFTQKLLTSTGQPKQHKVPESRFNTTVSPHKVFDAIEFPLSHLKKIKNAVDGATINDVVLTICAGAMRKYLQHHKELPEAPIVAWVPINARSKSDGNDENIGNKISAMTTPIYTNMENPLERLTTISASTKNSKEAKSGVSARLMTDLSRHVPAATQVLASRLMIQSTESIRPCNMFISNVPGPQIPTFMCGSKMVRSFGMAPLSDGMGLFIATPSYDGKISFSVTSTREIMPDVGYFIECVDASMQELLMEAGNAVKISNTKKPKATKKISKKKTVKKKSTRKKAAKKQSATKKVTQAKKKPKKKAVKKNTTSKKASKS